VSLHGLEVLVQKLHVVIDLVVFSDLVVLDLSVFAHDADGPEKIPGILGFDVVVPVQEGGGLTLLLLPGIELQGLCVHVDPFLRGGDLEPGSSLRIGEKKLLIVQGFLPDVLQNLLEGEEPGIAVEVIGDEASFILDPQGFEALEAGIEEYLQGCEDALVIIESALQTHEEKGQFIYGSFIHILHLFNRLKEKGS
jgi:hypothetical protein